VAPTLPSRVNQARPELQASFERGKKAWPGVELGPDQFVARLTEGEIATDDLTAHAEELYLAIACAAGDPLAHRLFEDHFLSQIPRYVSRFRFAPDLMDEVLQRVRLKQLFGEHPGVSRYRGRGPLGAWIRATAVRVAFDVATQAGKPTSDWQTELFDVWKAFDDGPEAQAIKDSYRERLSAALQDSLAALGPRDKTLLRLHVVDQLSIDVIGRIYRVHRATVARWLVAIRAQVFNDLRTRAALYWGVSTNDLRSLVRILGDEIHMSAKRILTEE
jgi:RNA polymerase sigma-70 factor (ECF subfamily)